jgi:hypothetical protein
VERRKPSGTATAPGRVAAQSEPSLANIAALIDEGGQITIGELRPIKCAAIANDHHDCLAMLQRKSSETLQQLLERLDAAIDRARTTGEFTDEINARPRKALR